MPQSRYKSDSLETEITSLKRINQNSVTYNCNNNLEKYIMSAAQSLDFWPIQVISDFQSKCLQRSRSECYHCLRRDYEWGKTLLNVINYLRTGINLNYTHNFCLYLTENTKCPVQRQTIQGRLGKYLMFNMNVIKSNHAISVKNAELLWLKKMVSIVTEG
jgi:hypothetical protein